LSDAALADVQWILGHAHLSTTELYLNTAPQDAIDDVLAHYRRRAEAEQAPPAALSDGEPGYRAEILDALFGDVQREWTGPSPWWHAQTAGQRGHAA
jgi:hypothetical protein